MHALRPATALLAGLVLAGCTSDPTDTGQPPGGVSTTQPGTYGTAGKCNARGERRVSGEVQISAFAAHRVVVDYQYCGHGAPLRFDFIGLPVVTAPVRLPGGGQAEQLDVIKEPEYTGGAGQQVELKFTIRQKVVRVVGEQDFVFDLTFGTWPQGHTRLCLGKTCRYGR